MCYSLLFWCHSELRLSLCFVLVAVHDLLQGTIPMPANVSAAVSVSDSLQNLGGGGTIRKSSRVHRETAVANLRRR